MRILKRVLKKSTRTTTNVSNAKLAVTCSLFFFRVQKPCVTLFGWNYCFRKKDKVGLPKREILASNATVHPPIKTLHDKSRGR